jgi:hypothetical protein
VRPQFLAEGIHIRGKFGGVEGRHEEAPMRRGAA